MTPPTPLRFAILASLGVLQGCTSSAVEPGPEVDVILEQAQGLAGHKDWRRCLAAWRDAGEAAFGGDPYPFTDKGKAKLVERIQESQGLVQGLQGEGLLTPTEAGLLEADIATLLAGVYAKRPREMEMATCYEPMMYTPRRDALESLAPRVELLEGLAAQQTLQAEVVVRVLELVRKDLTMLSTQDGAPLNPDEQARADDVERRVTAAIATIEHRLGSPHDGSAHDPPQPVDPTSIIPEATGGE